MAEWLCRGLQILRWRFDSSCRVQPEPGGESRSAFLMENSEEAVQKLCDGATKLFNEGKHEEMMLLLRAMLVGGIQRWAYTTAWFTFAAGPVSRWIFDNQEQVSSWIKAKIKEEYDQAKTGRH